jgi:hypothetical protein
MGRKLFYLFFTMPKKTQFPPKLCQLPTKLDCNYPTSLLLTRACHSRHLQHGIDIRRIHDQALDTRADAKHAPLPDDELLFVADLHLELPTYDDTDACLVAIGCERERAARRDSLGREGDVLEKLDGLADGDVGGEVWRWLIYARDGRQQGDSLWPDMEGLAAGICPSSTSQSSISRTSCVVAGLTPNVTAPETGAWVGTRG